MLKNLYCIAGPSGSGKTTLANSLAKKYSMIPVASYTTRPMRVGEVNGEGHIFVTEEEFHDLGEMVAYTEFDGHEYGVTKEMLDQSDLYVIDLEGIDYLKDHYKERKVIVLGIDPGPAECIFRMQLRGDAESSIESRVENDWDAFEELTAYANVMLDAALSPDELAKQAWSIISSYEQSDISLDRVKMLLQEYISYDYESTEPGYIRETLDNLGFTKEDIQALDLGWIYPDDEA